MSSFKNTVLLVVISVFTITLFSCKQESAVVEENKAHTDSLMSIINSPELKALNQKILDKPNDPSLYNERSRLYLKFKQVEDALSDSRRAISLDSTNATYYLTAADVYFASNRTRQAKDILESVVKKFPTNTEGLLKLAELFYFVKQYDNAFERINQALKIDEHIAKAYYLKGNIYKEIGDTAKAISSLETAIEQDNKNYGAYLDLGLIYASRGNAIALEYYDNALSIDPLSTEALYAKAKLLQDIERTDEAITLYERILKHDSLHIYSVYNIGALQLGVKKDAEKAITYFTKAIDIDPRYAEAYFARGASYEELKEKSKAEADYRMCLQIRPNFPPAVEALNNLK